VSSTSVSTSTSVSETRVAENVTVTQSTSAKKNTVFSTAKSIISSTVSQQVTPSTSENGPTVPSLLLSLVLKEPLERSHGRISLITSIQSFFQSTVPAPPPFDYSTLVDHALLAGQIALHDPNTRQQKRLPIVVSLSIGAFLVAATGIIPRYFGWAMLAGATWFGPGRFLVKDMWYISVAFVAMALVIDVFPMLSLCTLAWTGFIAVSRIMDERGKKAGVVGREQNAIQLMHNTAQVLQSGGAMKPVALDIVQNVTEWWAFRQSEAEKQKRKEEKAAKEERRMEKLRRVETEKEMKKTRLEEKEAERLRKIEEEMELKRIKTEEKEAEKLRRKQKQEEELALKRVRSEEKEAEKQRKREQELEAKRLKLEEKESKKRKELEEKERQRREKSDSDFVKRKEEETKMLTAHLTTNEKSGVDLLREEEQTRMLTAHLISDERLELERLKRVEEERRMLNAHLVTKDATAEEGGLNKLRIDEPTDIESLAPIPDIHLSVEPELKLTEPEASDLIISSDS
jgi:hypothetical protein